MKRGKGRKAAAKRVKPCREGKEGCCEEKERKAAVHEERERKAALKRGKGEKLFMVLYYAVLNVCVNYPCSATWGKIALVCKAHGSTYNNNNKVHLHINMHD